MDVDPNKNENGLEIIVQLLMPGIVFECSDIPPYEGGSWNNVHIHQLLSSHILSSNQRYLIPINCLSKLGQIDADIAKLENIHAIIFGDKKYTFVDAKELNKIKYHSAETQEVFSAYEALQTLVHQDVSSLFGKINLLLKELYSNSVQGFGSERVAGFTAERSIRHFVNFYKQLTPQQKDCLSAGITEQIKYLHICIADYSLGRLEYVDAYTICMATRRQKLKEVIQGHQKLLSHCTLLDTSATAVLDKAMERLSNGVLS